MAEAADVVINEPAVEDDDMWLYGEDGQPTQSDNVGTVGEQQDIDEVPPEMNNVTDSEQDQLQALFADDEPPIEVESEGNQDGGGDVPQDGQIDGDIADGDIRDGDHDGQDDGDSDDSDDDDDDIQVTIGPVNTTPGLFPTGGGPVNLNIQKRGPAAFSGTPGAQTGSKGGSGTVKQLDMDAEGSINGENIFDVDLSTLEDKPWRKPGADITDYFNYGFNEDTWKVSVSLLTLVELGFILLITVY